MKTLIVNRTTHPAVFSSCKNLGQMISWLEAEGEKENYYIVQMTLNGQKMDEDEEKLLDGLAIKEVQEIQVGFSSIEELMGKTITTIISAIQEIQLNTIKFCKEFRTANKIDDEKVKFILIQCRSVINSLEEIFKAHMSKKLILKHHSLWIESERELTNILQCILQSRNLRDVNFVSDLLEYDLVQALNQWDETLEKEILDNPQISTIFSLNINGQNGDNGVNA